MRKVLLIASLIGLFACINILPIVVKLTHRSNPLSLKRLAIKEENTHKYLRSFTNAPIKKAFSQTDFKLNTSQTKNPPSLDKTDRAAFTLDYCFHLLQDNKARDESIVRSRKADLTTDEDVLKILKSGCAGFRKRFKFMAEEGIFITREETFPVAYSIVVHKQLNQIAMLLSAIYRPQNLYCVHVDAKSEPSFERGMTNMANCFPNVFLSSKSEKVVYASFSRLQADINCMRDLLIVPKQMYNWKYLINLCGQDFPVSTNKEIVEQLKELKEKNSIAGTRELNSIAKARTQFVHRLRNVTNAKNETVEVDVQTNEKHVAPPRNTTVVKNLAYNVFTRNFLQWALKGGSVGAELLNWSSVTHTPDEHFWGMLNTYPNAPGGSNFVSWWQIARAVLWKSEKTLNSCHGYWMRGVCVFGGDDLPWLMNVPQMFVNKFDVTHDVTPMACIREFLDRRSMGQNTTWNPGKAPLLPPKQMLET